MHHPLVLSPNAEPLTGGDLGWRPCEAVLGDWAVRVDSTHSGAISRQDFLADARAQFARMDGDGDGFITADELSAYRAPFRPIAPPREPHIRRGDGDDGAINGRIGFPGGGWGGGRGGGPHDGGGGPRDGGGSDRSTLTTGEDPVMAADTNLDFKVSLDEFLRQATLIFDSLDLDHNGTLDLTELRRFCPAFAKK
ncbi:hypothetical protein [Magnetospirillum fulvum]|uniref:EF-hand domain-containing protein n=1 Tax=Magnetospirillum fulvum MGU-K5 TaxID=1316936 RepID=S9S402_MAGFU|nr:hypothetical protein [Magnetospirillum fulvum]EPY00632.1 hypothetical protein K678_15134 [Magnetospirillum fulvum MGU-K5]